MSAGRRREVGLERSVEMSCRRAGRERVCALGARAPAVLDGVPGREGEGGVAGGTGEDDVVVVVAGALVERGGGGGGGGAMLSAV